MTLMIDSIEAAVDHVLDTVKGDIVLGIPLGIGKPNPFVNALYRRVKANSRRRMRIITALSLIKPAPKSDLERAFLQPLVERVFGDYPDLEYAVDLRNQALPPNIEVREFFMKTADYIGNDLAQQSHISTNYTFVARDMLLQGINVIAQAVAVQGESDSMRLSLSSNPDVTFEVIEKVRGAGRPLLAVGVINRKMPFMPNGAEVAPEFFDVVVTDPAGTHTLFGPPNNRVGFADYAIGLHASSFVADGGTLQIGIGSLGDAIAQSLIVRERHAAEYRSILESLCPDGLDGRELGRFEEGIYGCSEMFVNGFLKLIEAGIVRREVFADTRLQQLINEQKIPAAAVTARTLQALLESGRIRSPLRDKDLAFLKRFGILREGVTLEGNALVFEGRRYANDLNDPAHFASVAHDLLGARLKGGIYMTGGFFLGPNDFYERLRTMPPQELAKIDMTRIDFINSLDGQSELKRAQRSKARFMNTTMIVTLLGAAASDALESGQVVSGVGGQYNFVAMAHALPDARLLMMLRATHETKDGLTSSIVWKYGNITIPRHLRDIFITEYGVADLRGQPDSEVIKRLIAIADSRFQDELVREAKSHGKLEASYEVPPQYRQNLPEVIAEKLAPWQEAGLLPPFPFGTDLTPEEIALVTALKKLKHASEHPTELLSLAFKAFIEGKDLAPSYQKRLGLEEVHGIKDLLLRKLLAGNL
ncbi:acetyl-CoA hydrolase/transferase C-terminal domain-containing protein [Tibeticola sp.]|jgi:acyl-CoA hydrolase|uniref:acetyl-CoA hydrolase/transferase C-terminal domain-containing protein n=1 Tax=Tibeticola sp. TaxID=2005368 RepID=UPI00258F1613|nr:acetyl-CoA hydrolase/transferase C-terminal domain-containing protein [Tibeticola sp.]MCI4441653.1 acetyl-CoA hydrolase [Tibeticola sp.]